MFLFQLLVYKLFLHSLSVNSQRLKERRKKYWPQNPAVPWWTTLLELMASPETWLFFVFFWLSFFGNCPRKHRQNCQRAYNSRKFIMSYQGPRSPHCICKHSNVHWAESFIMHCQLTDTWLLAVLDSFPTQHKKNCSSWLQWTPQAHWVVPCKREDFFPNCSYASKIAWM